MTFLQSVTHTLIQGGWENLRNYTLVFPMQRAALFTKTYMQQQLQESGYPHPVVLPRMLTIDQLVDDLSEMRVEDEIRAVCRLYRLYKKHFRVEGSEPISLDAFYGWGSQLLTDFSSIEMALQDTRLLVGNTAAAQVYENSELDPEMAEHLRKLMNLDCVDTGIRAFFLRLWEALPVIYEQFVDENKTVGTKGRCYRWVIDHFPELLATMENRTYVFVGFNYLLPAEHRLMELFRDAGRALFFWDYDPAFRLDDTVYQFIRQHIQEFGNAWQPETEAPHKPEITAIATMSANAQAQYVSQWLSTLREGERAAIVIADEQMLESVLYALPGDLSGKLNITKGYPLRNTHIFAEVQRYLTDAKHDRRSDEVDYVGVLERLAAHLQVPAMPLDADKAAWQDLLQVESYCQTIRVINRFAALMREQVLTDVQQLRTLRNLLRRCLESVTLPFHGEPIEQVQIIGVLETRLLDFDNILILNVEEGVVPGASTDRSFIPFDLRKAYHMQTHDEESKVYAYNFFRLLRRANSATMLFSEATGGMSKKSMSRFLMQLLLSPDYQVNKYRINESANTVAAQPLQPTHTWLSKVKADWMAGDKKKPLTLSLSPSALASYIQCPRQFYLGSVLRVQQVEGASLILSPSELGSVFHGAVMHAYEVIAGGGKPITEKTPVEPDKLRAYIADQGWVERSDMAIDAGYQEVISEYNKYHTPAIGEELYVRDAHKAENEVIRQMLRGVLQYDVDHLCGLRLLRQEAKYRREVHVEGCEVPIMLGGSIDRLDLVEQDKRDVVRVVDYKTGSFSDDKVQAKSIADLFNTYDSHYVLQTLIYSYVLEAFRGELGLQNEPIMPQLMFTQKLSADQHVQIGNVPVTDFARYRADFEAALHQKLQELLNDSTFEQCEEKICAYAFCPFHLLCGREKKEVR